MKASCYLVTTRMILHEDELLHCHHKNDSALRRAATLSPPKYFCIETNCYSVTIRMTSCYTVNCHYQNDSAWRRTATLSPPEWFCMKTNCYTVNCHYQNDSAWRRTATLSLPEWFCIKTSCYTVTTGMILYKDKLLHCQLSPRFCMKTNCYTVNCHFQNDSVWRQAVTLSPPEWFCMKMNCYTVNCHYQNDSVRRQVVTLSPPEWFCMKTNCYTVNCRYQNDSVWRQAVTLSPPEWFCIKTSCYTVTTGMILYKDKLLHCHHQNDSALRWAAFSPHRHPLLAVLLLIEGKVSSHCPWTTIEITIYGLTDDFFQVVWQVEACTGLAHNSFKSNQVKQIFAPQVDFFFGVCVCVCATHCKRKLKGRNRAVHIRQIRSLYTIKNTK